MDIQLDSWLQSFKIRRQRSLVTLPAHISSSDDEIRSAPIVAIQTLEIRIFVSLSKY